MSSLHRKISVGTLTLERSALLSDVKVTREGLGDLGIRPAEAVGQFLAKLWTVRITHDGRGHRGGPTHVIVFQEVEKLRDLLFAEAAHVVAVVDVLADGPTNTIRPNRSGAFNEAKTPIIALTE
jgi:hypothetical protein